MKWRVFITQLTGGIGESSTVRKVAFITGCGGLEYVYG